MNPGDCAGQLAHDIVETDEGLQKDGVLAKNSPEALKHKEEVTKLKKDKKNKEMEDLKKELSE